jgi:hypothetical protein
MKQLWTALVIFTLISIAACAAPAPMRSSGAADSAAPVPAQPPAPEAAQQGQKTGTNANTPSTASQDRMIVYTVHLSLEVQDADKAASDIAAIVAQYKGYVSATNLSRDSKERMRGSVTVRIPAESLDSAQKQIEAAGLKVLNRNKSSNDVTDQYTDLNAQLTNAQAAENELRELLKTVRERSNKAEDILAVYNRLTEVQNTIERLKGQMNVLEKTTAFATITIDLTPHEEVQILEPDTWIPNRTAAQALRTLIKALQGLGDLAIWVILFLLPLLIVFALPFVGLALILRAFFRRKKKIGPPA